MASDLHVAILPWSAFGHLIPFYNFSVALAKAGVHVSFLSTPKNIERLPKPSPTLTPLLKLVALPFPVLDKKYDFPEDCEATVDIPAAKIPYLKIAYDLLKQPFKQFVAEKSPDWIIVDFSPFWAVDVAAEFNIPLIYLSVFTGAMGAFFGPSECMVGEGQERFKGTPESLTSPPEWIDFPSSVALRLYEARGYHSEFYGENASGVRDAERVAKVLGGCQAVAARSCYEFEEEYLTLSQKILKKPVIPIGLLLPEKPENRGRGGSSVSSVPDGKWSEIFEWLDSQEPKSVVFVRFGSECKLSKDQVYEIAYGLELSELPFLWAIRKPNWAAEETETLPPGFADRTKNRGIVCIGWAPQLEILAHRSIGGSLFHAGWGSVIETLQYGHCLILLPFIIDQPLNARLLVEKGLAVEVDRGEDGSFSRNDIAKSLRLAMVSDEGKELRDRNQKLLLYLEMRCSIRITLANLWSISRKESKDWTSFLKSELKAGS